MNTKSRKSIKPTKSAPASTEPTQPVQPVNPGRTPDEAQSNLVRIHDLTGFTAVCIPAELRGLIGDEAYERLISNVELHELMLILREPNDVVYIRMPIVHFPTGQGIPAALEAVMTRARTGAKVRAKAEGNAAAKPSTSSARKTRGSP